MSKEIDYIECRHVVHSPRTPDGIDKHYVKEIRHYKDGTVEPVLNVLKNIKRPFYVTKKQYQNHNEKKDFEELNKVDKYTCTQSELTYSVANALGQRNFRGSLRDICSSPYVYFADLDSTTYIKKELYMDKYPDKPTTPNKVAVFDTETNMLTDEEEVIMASTSCGNVVYHAVVDYVLKNPKEYENKIISIFKEKLSKLYTDRSLTFNIKVCSNSLEVIKHVIDGAHAIKPDILAVWNIDFDIKKTQQACDKHDYPIECIFSHPKLPNTDKFFKYIRSPDMKVTASGKVQPIMNYDQWHWVHIPAHFCMIDFMQAYKRNRVGKQEELSYTLDHILSIEKIEQGKYKIEAADKYKGADWHIYMQRNHIEDYGVYNIIDCIAVEMLDEKTKDLSIKLPALLEFSNANIYHKQPRHAANLLTYDALEQGYVFACAGNAVEQADKHVDSRSGWITAQPTLTLLDEGLECTEIPGLKTRVYVGNADSDVSASYPTNQIVANVAKITTRREFVEMKIKLPRQVYREFTMDILCGPVNSYTTMTKLCRLPGFLEVSKLYDEIHNSQ